MTAWPKVRLGEVLQLDLEREPVDPSKSYAMVGVLSFGRGLFDREAIENGNTSYRVFHRLKSDHVVMSQLFGWEGALALSSEKFAGKYLSPQFPTFLADNNRLDRDFLGWLMKRPLFWEDLGTRASGMGDRRRTLNPDALFACEIPLPPLAEQRRVVMRIEALAAQIHEARTLREDVDADLAALLRTIIRNGPTTPTPMHELMRLRSPDVPVQRNETYQFAGVYSFGRGVFKASLKSGTDFAYPRLSRLRKGDFVYPKLMAWEGAFGVVPPECDGCVVSTEFPVFEINRDRIEPDVLDVYFRDPANWESVAGGSIGTNARRRRLSPSDLLKYEFPLPTASSQATLVAVRAEADAANRLKVETDAQIDALLPAILDRAFKGAL